VIAMPDSGVEKTRRVVPPPGVGDLRLYVRGRVVGVFINRRCETDRVEATGSLRSAIEQYFNKDEAVEFRSCIVDTVELPTSE
jgi:hypothetical protein